MKKITILGIVLIIVSILVNFYVTNYYCVGDDYCLYKISDGITENLIYLSFLFLGASLVSLIGGKNKLWLVIFSVSAVFLLVSDQTCSTIGCFNRDNLLIITIILTLLTALITNLIGKFKK